MALSKLNRSLKKEVEQLSEEGRAKQPERIIEGYVTPTDGKGPRYKIKGTNQEFIRMNSNSYLSLSNHPDMIAAADKATHEFGVGPGAVRFIDGTFNYHIELEKKIAEFTGKESAKIFNSAYTANLSLALTISGATTYWIGDELNHNSIIRAMRISNIPRENRSIYAHNNMDELRKCLDNIPTGIERVCIIFDGIFSMRGDAAPMDEIQSLTAKYDSKFRDGVVTIVDDSHGIGAYGSTGRGTPEFCKTEADIIVGTFGKAFGVNGGFVAGSEELSEAIRQKADTYIYTNPLSVADCAAATTSLELIDTTDGKARLQNVQDRIKQFRSGIKELGLESIDGPHPVVPILVRDTAKTHHMVKRLFDLGILVVGLTFPVVPKGNETIRVQINAGLTQSDIDYVLDQLKLILSD